MKNQTLKTIFWILILFGAFAGSAFASDSINIEELNKPAQSFINGIEFFAKWGGILLICITALMIGFGKAQGQVAHYLASAAIAIGLLSAAWGWFGTSFTHGFVF
jgi:hypothetical protein